MMFESTKYLWFLIIALICLGRVSQAQFYETINSSRPGQSIGAYTVGRGTYQIQSGIDNFGFTNDSTGSKGYGYLTNTAVRFGLTDSFEVAAFFEFRDELVSQKNSDTRRSGLSNCLIGLRHQISVGKGLAPSIGFQFRIRLPVMSDYYKIDNAAPSFIFVTSQKLSKSITLITNLGGSWNGTDSTPLGLYTLNFSCAFTKKFGFFVESYGSFTHGRFEARMDSGVAWMATKNLQLDILGGYGRNYDLIDYFVSTGFSWRTRFAKRNISDKS